jgi:hypothetical protein
MRYPVRPYGYRVMNRQARAIGLCLLAAAAGCAQVQPTSCVHVGGTPMLNYELFFGRGIPGRAPLTDQEWAEFAEQVVTPHLPDGFTALDADGQWMNPAMHRISRERTKVLVVALPDTAVAASDIAAIKDAYRARFHQQSVGTIVHPACGAF